MRFNPEKLNLIAEGAEKNIYDHPDSQEKVVADFKDSVNSNETERTIKGRYYINKILHLLLPQSVPDIYYAYKGEKGTQLISQKKNLDEAHINQNQVRKEYLNNPDNNQLIIDKYEALRGSREDKLIWDDNYIDLLGELNDLGVHYDPAASNFGYDENHNLVYIDNSFTPWWVRANGNWEKKYDAEKILEASQKLSNNKKEKISLYLSRLDSLFKEEKELHSENETNS